MATAPRKSPIENRYSRIKREISRTRRSTQATKELEKDISYEMNEIERYGFQFFPNLYIHDKVVRLEAMHNQLVTAQTEEKKGV